ncbi:LytTR family DNA-binding domain-containing protein [Lactobacillus sp.]|uniref:LytTR family DNA-binding domain-containing protein n=1 Tax=Lactobacillus sp. TaxID=1591 RepID=UPI003EF2B651
MKINCHVDENLDEERAEIWVKEMTPELANLIRYLDSKKQVLWCYQGDELKPIAFSEIYAIQTADHGLDVSTASSHYTYYKQLASVKELLSNDFVEASRSAFFNFNYIDHLVLLDNGAIDVVLKNQQRIPISRRKMKNLKERIGL